MDTEHRRKADTTYVHCTDNGHTFETVQRRQRMYGVQTTYVHRTGEQHRSTEGEYVSTRNHAQQINRQNVFLNPYSPAGGKK